MTLRDEAHDAALNQAAWGVVEALGVGAEAASDVWEPKYEAALKQRNLLRRALICADHVDWGLMQDEAKEVRRILGNGVI